jgi:hypothetical protein
LTRPDRSCATLQRIIFGSNNLNPAVWTRHHPAPGHSVCPDMPLYGSLLVGLAGRTVLAVCPGGKRIRP